MSVIYTEPTPRIVRKSIQLAHDLFPSASAVKVKRYQVYHFAFIYYRNKLISIGQNSQSEDRRALYFAQRFNVPHIRQYPWLHSEISAISRLWGRHHIDGSERMVVIRTNKFGELHNSKPCVHCTTVLQALNINKVWYSGQDGNIHFGI